MIRTGPLNCISDVGGITVGHAEDQSVRTGTTVILCDPPCIAAVDIRGGGPGTREVAALDPSCMIERIDGISLSGGSVYGLAAADGLVGWLAEHGRGLQVAGACVPIVPGLILFDLNNQGNKDWGGRAPYSALARVAAERAAAGSAQGSVGAGFGALCGDLSGGLGTASTVLIDPPTYTVGALAVVNAYGSAVHAADGGFWAAPYLADGDLGDAVTPWVTTAAERDAIQGTRASQAQAGANTTLVVVATDARLSKAQAQRLAIMAQDGLARAVRPVHTPYDGDSVIALATGAKALHKPIEDLYRLGHFAADAVARAIVRALFYADGMAPWPSYRMRFGAF
ncbi:MAG: P1 family peptidase [Geminicoccaceae bacterium]